MISKIYKLRKSGPQEAKENFSCLYKQEAPSNWTDFQFRHVAHIIKWATLSFNTREPVKLSKSLLIRELGQRGYLKHISMIYPVVQGHNLGQGQITTYDYRSILKQLVNWYQAQGLESFEQFKLILKAVIEDIETTYKKKLSWFWRMISFWFLPYSEIIKRSLKVKNESTVTTIQESYKDNKRFAGISSAENPAFGNSAFERLLSDDYLIDFLRRCGKDLRRIDEALGRLSP